MRWTRKNIKGECEKVSLKELLGEDLYTQVMEKAGEQKIAVVSDGN